jgi:hypothetical protein
MFSVRQEKIIYTNFRFQTEKSVRRAAGVNTRTENINSKGLLVLVFKDQSVWE